MRTTFHARHSIVTFRLTSEEYDLVKLASTAAKSRSVSDYARGAVMQRVESDLNPASRDQELPVISACLERLDAAMKEVDGKLTTILRRPTFREREDRKD